MLELLINDKYFENAYRYSTKNVQNISAYSQGTYLRDVHNITKNKNEIELRSDICLHNLNKNLGTSIY